MIVWKQGGSEIRKKRTKHGMKHHKKIKTVRRYEASKQGRAADGFRLQ